MDFTCTPKESAWTPEWANESSVQLSIHAKRVLQHSEETWSFVPMLLWVKWYSWRLPEVQLHPDFIVFLHTSNKPQNS